MKRYIRSDHKFNKYQQHQIELGRMNGLDVSMYADPQFGDGQMAEIRQGLQDGVDVRTYADPRYSAKQMANIRRGFDPDHVDSYFSKDVASISDIEDEIFKAMQAGTTKDDIEDYLIELESDGIIDREEFKDLKQSTFGEFDRYKKTFGSSTIRADWAEDLSEDLKDVNPNPQPTPEQKEYVYRCVADSPEVPDMDAPEEEWSVFRRDEKEYKAWAFADAVEDGIFVDDEYNLFNNLWAEAETQMAAPYA